MASEREHFIRYSKAIVGDPKEVKKHWEEVSGKEVSMIDDGSGIKFVFGERIITDLELAVSTIFLGC